MAPVIPQGSLFLSQLFSDALRGWVYLEMLSAPAKTPSCGPSSREALTSGGQPVPSPHQGSHLYSEVPRGVLSNGWLESRCGTRVGSPHLVLGQQRLF